MALIGYRQERRKIDEKIAEIESRLNGRTTTTTASTPGRARRHMSAAAKARIAAAQKKRWARFRQQKASNAAPAKKTAAGKRRRKPVSAEVRQKRLEALAKARAARAAKRSPMVKTAGS